MTNRTLRTLLGPVAALVLFVGTITGVWSLQSDRAQAASLSQTPGAAEPAAAPATAPQSADKPYQEAEYRTFPVVGSRVAIWVVA
ncbi:MAG: hypothetical protein ABIX28_20620, partial [Vicinamibacterales bacterium]